jgi:hypothetical protein
MSVNIPEWTLKMLRVRVRRSRFLCRVVDQNNREKVIRTAPQLAPRWKLPKIGLLVKRYAKILEIVGESLLFLISCELKEKRVYDGCGG